ncbi:MAG: hypothetical protein HC892_10055 [Saprospiraceae bacterium]|nr:hypothetical protein [Saprospiraceae bacterium]
MTNVSSGVWESQSAEHSIIYNSNFNKISIQRKSDMKTVYFEGLQDLTVTQYEKMLLNLKDPNFK